mmetsp:Transcript_14273/g.23600  ORF Transcript_14273/g.23600 Transcript_14273/m.23600 type:complete len:182 (-) Transcript_14273:583-1128(-)
MDCQWVLKAPANHHLRLNFTSFRIESGYDFVRVYASFTVLLARLTGSIEPPPVILVNSSSAFVTFTSDSTVTYSGFQAVVYAVPARTPTRTPPRTRTRPPTPQTSTAAAQTDGVQRLSAISDTGTTNSDISTAVVVASVAAFVVAAVVIASVVTIRRRQARTTGVAGVASESPVPRQVAWM